MDSAAPVITPSTDRTSEPHLAGNRSLLLRLILAAQPITRAEIAARLGIDRSTVTENVKPLIDSGILCEDTASLGGQRKQRVVSFSAKRDIFVGVNLGVRHSQVGITTLEGKISDEEEFVTPSDPERALLAARERIERLRARYHDKLLRVIGVSVPGMTDAARRRLLYPPNLGWRELDVAKHLQIDKSTPVIVENDSTAAALYEARHRTHISAGGLMTNFVLVRSGTGIGVGLVIGGEVHRGTGTGRGVAGEFGHMTIVAGGKLCVCGNRGCWERYASASSAASLYLGDRPLRPGESAPRFVEIVSRAKNGEPRACRTLEKIGEYLGIGIANVIMGTGIPNVIISGRLVYGWKFLVEPLNAAIGRSIIGKTAGWSVEAGLPAGGAIGGALEVAINEYLMAI